MKLKKSSLEQPEMEEVKTGGAFISARHRNPSEEIAQEKPKADLIGALCAIAATVLLVAVTALLYMNWDAIKSA